MSNLVPIALAAPILFLSFSTYFAVKLIRRKAEAAERSIARRLEQLHAMQYNQMRKQGWSHEELSEAFPAISSFGV